jgi:hypothetical protein
LKKSTSGSPPGLRGPCSVWSIEIAAMPSAASAAAVPLLMKLR